MKKVLALLATALIGTTTLLAQDAAATGNDGVRFGIKLAPNLAWTRPDSKGLSSDGTKLGYTFGLMMEFPIGAQGNYRFASGLYLNNIGGKFTADYKYKENPTGPELTKALKSDLSLRYIDVPLTIKMMTSEIGYMRYFGQLGVSAGFNVRAKADLDQPVYDASGAYTTSFTTLEKEDVQDKTALFKAGLVIGGGMEYNFSGNTTLLLGVTYNNALTNLADGWEYNGVKSKIYANYLEFTAGIYF